MTGDLFQCGEHILSGGHKSKLKIDCDHLTCGDIRTLAYLTFMLYLPKRWGGVVGVPSGGTLFAEALRAYSSPPGPWLVADDVLTTGKSMEAMRQTVDSANGPTIGIVMYARGKCPDWVKAINQLPEELWNI